MTTLLTVLFLGLSVGSIYSLTATGLVLTYRTSGVFNFAHGALGMFFSYLFFQLSQGGRVNLVVAVYDQKWRLPVLPALVLVVGILAPALGWALDAVLFRRLREAGGIVKIVATIGGLIAMIGLAGVVWGPSSRLTPRSVFPRGILSLGRFRATSEELATLFLVVVLSGALLAFLRRSSLGVRMRAVVDRPDVAELMGVDSARVSAAAWSIGTAFAALGGILLAPFYGSLDVLTLSFLVVIATAAAVVGRLESLPLTVAGGFGIGVAQALVQQYAPRGISGQLRQAIPFLVLFAVVVLPIRWRVGSERPLPPPPRAPRALSPRGRMLRAGIVLAVVLAPPFFLRHDWQVNIAAVPPTALIFLSLILLSGFAGQISLGQAAFAGFGAFVTAHLVAFSHWPFLLAALAGALSAVPLGALLAARAARLPPLFLGLATLAFGSVMDEVVFQARGFSGGLGGIRFVRPGFLASPRAFYIAGLAVFALAVVLVENLRRGRTGLALAAMRDSQTGLAGLGTSVARLKFVSFCVSAFLAGLGGVMLSASMQLATPYSYFKVNSLLFLALAVIGGIGHWSGALVGAALFQLVAPLLHESFVRTSFVGAKVFHGQLESLLPVFFGLGAIGLAANPHGVVEQAREGLARLRARTARG